MSELYTPPRTVGNKISKRFLSKFQKIDAGRFSRYLLDQNKFVEDCLHTVKEDVEKIKKLKKIKKEILEFDNLYAQLRIPTNIELNILVVENRPKDAAFLKELKDLKNVFGKLRFYLVWTKLSEFKKEALQKQLPIAQYIDTDIGTPYETDKGEVSKLSLNDFDLILQDIFLEAGGISGSDLAELYFNVAPQAMVFFLTSMDIETLAASGYDNKVDRLVGKDRIKGIMKYYYDRFQELYGPLLWPVFEKSRDRKKRASITDRVSVRKLLGNIRTWTMAPKILFHGFALPEMVDHEFRHTLGLWKMANNILGPFLERMPDAMPYEDRVLLSLAIWLHDIGHRGDEHHFTPMEIRENHGAISESLILEHFDALGIDWLRDVCNCKEHETFRCCCGISNRNKITGCADGTELCALRKVGLMCRYHQSTAPLTENKLKELIPKLKMPSPYCIMGMDAFDHEVTDDYNQQIEQWLNKTENIKWFGTDIRTLDEFKGKDQLLKLTGMLRWLDALHTHSDKVGSVLEVKSFLSYLAMRKEYCKNRISEIDQLLDKTVVGSEAYLKQLEDRFSLDRYSELLEVQGIHLWRCGLVKDIKGEWFWDEKNQQWAYRILFELYVNYWIRADEEIKGNICMDEIEEKLPGETLSEKWSHHVWEEVLESEIKGQSEDRNAFFMEYFNGINICYCYKQIGDKLFELGVCE